MDQTAIIKVSQPKITKKYALQELIIAKIH